MINRREFLWSSGNGFGGPGPGLPDAPGGSPPGKRGSVPETPGDPRGAAVHGGSRQPPGHLRPQAGAGPAPRAGMGAGRGGGALPEQSRGGARLPLGLRPSRAVRQGPQRGGRSAGRLRGPHGLRSQPGGQDRGAQPGHLPCRPPASSVPDSPGWGPGSATPWAA